MNSRTRILTARPSRILILVVILAALTSLSLNIVSVTNAQSGTETPIPGEGGDPGGPPAPVVTGTPLL